MKAIKLANSELYAIVDDEDYNGLTEYVWHYRNKDGKTFAERYIYKDYKPFYGKRYTAKRMHCEIMQTKSVEHLNGNALDNRRENLASRQPKAQ